MADSTLRLTFTQLRIRVAEFLGIAYYGAAANEAAQLPTDAHDLDLVGRLVNDGYARFISDHEKGWNFLTVPFSITFAPQSTGTVTAADATTVTIDDLAGDFSDDYFNGWQVTLVDEDTDLEYPLTVTDYVGATGVFTFAAVPTGIESGDTLQYAGASNVAGKANRYFLPDDSVGILKSPFTYGESGPRTRIDVVSEAAIRELEAGGNTSGHPTVFAVRAINTVPTTDGDRWEAVFWPIPNGTQTVTAIYKRFPNVLSSASDVSVAGFQHDRTVLAAALAEAELQRSDKQGPRETAYQSALTRSRKLDDRSRSARVAGYGDRSDEGVSGRPLNYYSVDTYNGIELNP